MVSIKDIPVSEIPKWLFENLEFSEIMFDDLINDINDFAEKEFS